MDKKWYRVLKEFGEYKAGSTIQLTDEEAKGALLVDAVELVLVDENVQQVTAALERKLEEAHISGIESGLKRAMEEVKQGVEGVRIKVGESQEEKLKITGGFKHFGHLIHDIYKAGRNGANASDTLKMWAKVAGHMAENDDPQGGYLVPQQFLAELNKQMLEASIVKQRARTIPMQTNSIAIPAINDTSHNASVYGGIVIYKPAEMAAKTASKPQLRLIELTLHKAVEMVYVTDELMSDSPISVAALLNEIFPEALAFYADNDYLTGTGAGEPLGAINAANPSLIATPIEAAQPATTIWAEKIINMWARLYPRGQNNAVWLCNNDCFPQLATMSLTVGAAGVPVWMPAGGLSGSPYASLMGRPLIMTEKCQTLGVQGDIALCDFSQYFIGQKAGAEGGISTAQSIHLRFDYDETVFRFVLRHDGQPAWNSDMTPMNSAITLSPFVVLAARP